MAQVTKNLRDGVLKISDATPVTPEEIELTLEEGDLTYEEMNNVINVLDRGDLDHMRQGDEEPVKVSFTLKFIEFIKQTGASDPTPYEALNKIGGASAWVSTNTDGGDVYTVDLEFTIVTPTTGETDEIVTLTKFHHNSISFNEGDEYSTLAVDGEAFITKASIAKAP